MMNISGRKPILIIALAACIQLALAQKQPGDEKLMKARILMSDYQDAMYFRNMNNGSYDPSWESIFESLFRTNSIIFDVPFRVSVPGATDLSKELPKSDEPVIISNYLEQTSIRKYIEIIRTGYSWFNLTNFTYSFIETGFDTLGLGSGNRMQFAYRKTFQNTEWSVRDSRTYIYDIQFFDGQPFITNVRLVEEEMAKTNVVLTFVNSRLRQGEPGYLLSELVGHLRFEFDESIYNSSLRAKTDSLGAISPGLIPNRASIKVDTAFGSSGDRYSIPSDWRTSGYKVSNQPGTGFVVPLMPWTWNGFSWSPRVFAGILLQGKNRLENLTPDSDFKNKPGYKFGAGVEVAKFFNMNQVASLMGNIFSTENYNTLKKRRDMYLGLGSGMYYYEFQYRITSEYFKQLPYWYTDRLETPVIVVVSGSAYDEIVSSSGISVPLFLEFRKNRSKLNQSFRAWSLQAGVNFIIPFETEFKIKGIFSRHGFYEEFNPQPITNDPFYNYYNESLKEIEDNIISAAFLPTWHFRLSGLFKFSGSGRDNLLDVSLLAEMPMRAKTMVDPGNFFIVAANDEFSSISNSKREIYKYFIGISIGYNFIKYRL